MENREKHLRKNLFSVAGAVLFYILYRLAFLVPGFVENVYSRGFFKFINQILSSVTGILPFSLAEFLVYGFAVFVVVYVIRTVLLLIFMPGQRLYKLLCRVVALVAIVANLFVSFVVLWGFNYAREPVAASMNLTVQPVEKQVLYNVCQSLVTQANALRQNVKQNDKGVFVSRYSKNEALTKVPGLYQKVASEQKQDIFSGNYGSDKPVLNGRGMSYAGLVGIYFPFTGEANVNTDIPVLTYLAGACHEAAHQHGFAREDEANFIAYYICTRNGDADFAYSGTMLALIYAGNALYDVDKDLFHQVSARYSDGVRRDLNDYNTYWDGFKGPTNDAVEAMNNTYLKANMQSEGVKSYGRMVDLLIALYQKEYSLPTKAADILPALG